MRGHAQSTSGGDAARRWGLRVVGGALLGGVAWLGSASAAAADEGLLGDVVASIAVPAAPVERVAERVVQPVPEPAERRTRPAIERVAKPRAERVVKPVAERVKPVAERVVRPVAGRVVRPALRPATDALRPVTDTLRPVTHTLRPATDALPPVVPVLPPAQDGPRPGTDVVPPIPGPVAGGAEPEHLTSVPARLAAAPGTATADRPAAADTLPTVGTPTDPAAGPIRPDNAPRRQPPLPAAPAIAPGAASTVSAGGGTSPVSDRPAAALLRGGPSWSVLVEDDVPAVLTRAAEPPVSPA